MSKQSDISTLPAPRQVTSRYARGHVCQFGTVWAGVYSGGNVKVWVYSQSFKATCSRIGTISFQWPTLLDTGTLSHRRGQITLVPSVICWIMSIGQLFAIGEGTGEGDGLNITVVYYMAVCRC